MGACALVCRVVTDLENSHEWISFEHPTEKHIFVFDVTFLESSYHCIFSQGCQGVLTGPAEELVQGCCSYGAHLMDEKDAKKVEKVAVKLSASQWQFKKQGEKGVLKRRTDKDGEVEITTRLVKDACIFLNRPDFERGAGCAIHVYAMDEGVSFVPLKPEVCWQLPLRREETTDTAGWVTTTITQWDRRHWGKGGEDFHWWCTEATEAFTGATSVYHSMSEELTELVGEWAYKALGEHLAQRAARPASVAIAHPTVRR